MLDKKNRLRKKKEFNYIYKKGEAFFSKYFTLFIINTKLKEKKIGFSVSNKVGNSVIRHRIKRLMCEAVRQNLAKLPLNNYVFVARPGSETLSLGQVTDNLFYLLKKAGLKLNNEG